MADGLIPRIWQENLVYHLANLEPSLEVFMKHRRRFDGVLGLLEEQRQALDSLEAEIMYVRACANRLSARSSELDSHIGTTRQYLAELKAAFDKAQSALTLMDRAHLDTAIDNVVRTRIRTDLDENRADIVDMETIARRQKLERIFANYLDIVSGLMIRDIGLDDGVCEIADDLIRIYGEAVAAQFTWTILGRSENDPIELAGPVRLGFPEWTVWALPLIGHEFWHVGMKNVPKIKDALLASVIRQGVVEKTALKEWNARLVQHCLADVFATFSMGPSYVCSALLLRLFGDSLDDRQRAEAILGATVRIGKKLPPQQEEAYGEVFQKLAASWYSGIGTPPPASGLGGDLNPDLARWTNALHSYLEPRPRLRYPEGPWLEVKDEWVSALKARVPITLKQNVLQGYRHVLHAAWQARIEVADSDDRAECTAKIGSEALRLCKEIKGRRDGPQDPPPTESELGPSRRR